MNEKSRDIDSLSITPASDDVASYKRTQGRSRPDAPRQSSFNGILVFVIVLMAIMMGIGGYTLYEVQKKLEESNVLLAKGQENVIELEQRLNATGTDVSKTLVSVKDQLETNGHEIRKLWDVTNKRNRAWIQENQTAIESNKKNVVLAQNSIKEITRQLGTVISSFETKTREVALVQQGLKQDNEDVLTQITLVRGQVQDQIIEYKKLSRQLTLVEGKQKDADEAIVAIDEHRRQLNKILTDLQNQIRALQGNSSIVSGG